MTPSEKRILEIYTILLINKIRRNNTNALKQLRAFFSCVTFANTYYDAEFLYETIIINLEVIEKIPSKQEVGLALIYETRNQKVKLRRSHLKGLISGIPNVRNTLFGDRIALTPKIRDRTDTFHKHLLTFYQEFAKIGKSLPI